MAKEKEILEQEIDEAVGDFILKKLDEYKTSLDESTAQTTQQLEAAYKAKQKELFSFVEKQVSEQTEKVKEEYSARMLAKLQEKNEYIEQLEESVDSFKETLAEKTHAFLTNAKDEVRTIVEEEARVDGDILKATHVLDEIRAILGVANAPTSIIPDEAEAQVARLSEDVEVLKERLEKKVQANKELNAKLKVFELVESIPSADRDFYMDQLSDVDSVNEAEERFEKIKSVVRNHKVAAIEEQLNESEVRGSTTEEPVDHSPRVVNEGESRTVNHMRYLAGIQD